MAPPGSPNTTSTPCISRLLISACAPVSRIVPRLLSDSSCPGSSVAPPASPRLPRPACLAPPASPRLPRPACLALQRGTRGGPSRKMKHPPGWEVVAHATARRRRALGQNYEDEGLTAHGRTILPRRWSPRQDRRWALSPSAPTGPRRCGGSEPLGRQAVGHAHSVGGRGRADPATGEGVRRRGRYVRQGAAGVSGGGTCLVGPG